MEEVFGAPAIRTGFVGAGGCTNLRAGINLVCCAGAIGCGEVLLTEVAQPVEAPRIIDSLHDSIRIQHANRHPGLVSAVGKAYPPQSKHQHDKLDEAETASRGEQHRAPGHDPHGCPQR